MSKPKALLFDIGGVVVDSPFRAIAAYEKTQDIPSGWINHAISRASPDGAWQRLERGNRSLDEGFFRDFGADLTRRDVWEEFCQRRQLGGRSAAVPEIDAEWLFWEMMRVSRSVNVHMGPALSQLKASGQFVLGALSNTVIFPPEHAYSRPSPLQGIGDVRSVFDIFVSSAHVGLRKPERQIYEIALRELDGFARGTMQTERESKEIRREGIQPQDVLFLDDIGENLKTAKMLGMRTLKVGLGRTKEAVEALEEITGLLLLDSDKTSREKL